MFFFRYTNYKIVINLSGVVQYNKNEIKEDATKLYKIMKYFKTPPPMMVKSLIILLYMRVDLVE